MQYHILRTTKYYNYDRSPLDTCRFWECLDVSACVSVCVCFCLAGWSHQRVSDILKSEPNELWKSRNDVPNPKPKKPKWNQSQQLQQKQSNNTKNTTTIKTKENQKHFYFGGVARKPQKYLGNVLNSFRTILRWGGKDVSQIAPYMGTNDDDDDDKGSLWAWEFLFARSFFCCFCFVLGPVQVQPRLQVHIEVARGRSFGRSVRSACSFRRSFGCS